MPGLVALGRSLSSVLVLHLFILHVGFLRIFLNQETFGDPRPATVSLELKIASLALECGSVRRNCEQHRLKW